MFASALPAGLIVMLYLCGLIQTFEIYYGLGFLYHGMKLCITIFGGLLLGFGLPIYMMLRRFQPVTRKQIFSVGFSLTALPIAIFLFLFPLVAGTNLSIDGVSLIIDGIQTRHGWLVFVQEVLFFGLCGLSGALAFWLMAPNKLKQTELQTLAAPV